MKLVMRIVSLCTLCSLCLASAAAEGAPVAADDSATTEEGRVVDIAVLGNDRDPDGGALRLASVTQAANGWVLVNGDETVRYQPDTGFTGLDDFAYTVVDAKGRASTAAVSVTVRDVPDAPVAEDQEVETEEDTALVIALEASDADGDRLSFEIREPPRRGSLGGKAPELSYTPDADYNGSDSFVFAVDDGHAGIDTGTVSIWVRAVPDDPVALNDEVVTDEGRVLDIAVLANDRDPDGYELKVVGVTQGANGSVLVNGDETVRYQPNTGFRGSDAFAYTIADEQGGTARAEVSVRVNDVPDAPVAEDQEVETEEDTALVIVLEASDADGDRLSFEIREPPQRGSLGGTPPELSYTPDANVNGSDRFLFAVEDGHGGTDTGKVSIQIKPVSDAPVAIDEAVETDEGRVLDIAVLANDSDPDGDALKVVDVTQGANGWVLVNGDETVRYQPNTGFRGLDGFAYTIADGQGNTARAAVSVRVKDVEDAPVAENQEVETEEDTAVAIRLVASDADGDRLAFEVKRPPQRGSLSGRPPDLSYAPDADYSGPDGFVFAVDDGHGGIDTGRVSIRVNPAGDDPVAADDEAATEEGRVVDIAVLANDRDPDGDVPMVVGVTQGANGSVLVNGDDTIRYQPTTGFTGRDGFAYTIADGDGGRATAEVRVAVRPVGDP